MLRAGAAFVAYPLDVLKTQATALGWFRMVSGFQSILLHLYQDLYLYLYPDLYLDIYIHVHKYTLHVSVCMSVYIYVCVRMFTKKEGCRKNMGLSVLNNFLWVKPGTVIGMSMFMCMRVCVCTP